MSAAPGSVFRIALAEGYGYAQLRACHRVYGDILGLDARCFPQPVADLVALNLTRIVIFPLIAAIDTGALDAAHAGTAAINGPPIPEFKFAVRDRTGAPIYWWIWTGEEIVLAEPGRDLDPLPERVVASRAQILQGWQPVSNADG
ncbi:MAG: hypothetical protein AAGC92_06665 [Pseudomonadota bacterium]